MGLRSYTETHIDEDCSLVRGGHENGLFYNCKFNKLNDLTLKNCVLTKSEFRTSSIRDMLGFTLTLDCNSLQGVTLSPELLDTLLVLLSTTEGNDSKRTALLDVVGKRKSERILALLKQVE